MLGQGRRRQTSRMLLGLLPCLFVLALGAPAASAVVTISDPQVSETNGAATAIFTVTRTTGLFFGGATIHFASADGSAHAPGDYAGVAGDLQFGGSLFGETQVQTVPVTVEGDLLDEPAESFRLLLSGSAEIADADGTATIADDDPLPQVGVSDAPPAAEGDSATFTVSLSPRAGARSPSTSPRPTAARSPARTTALRAARSRYRRARRPRRSRCPSPTTARTSRTSSSRCRSGRRASRRWGARPPPPRSPTQTSLSRPCRRLPQPGDGPSATAPDAPGGTADADGAGRAGRDRAPARALQSAPAPPVNRPRHGLLPPRGEWLPGPRDDLSRPNPRSKIKALRQERRLGLRNFTLLSGKTRTLTIALRGARPRPASCATEPHARRTPPPSPQTDSRPRRRAARRNGTLIARATHT